MKREENESFAAYKQRRARRNFERKQLARFGSHWRYWYERGLHMRRAYESMMMGGGA